MMEKGFTYLVEITAILSVLGLTFQVQGGAMIDQTLDYGCSRYTFYAESQRESVSFVKSRGMCKVKGSDLVSIESNEEWNFLKYTINKFPGKGTEYYIGLTKDKDGSWRWISNNSTVNKSYWAPGESTDANCTCAVMYKDYNGYYGLFDDLPCKLKRHGYICEKPTCKPTTPKESDIPTSVTGPHFVSLTRGPSTKDRSKAIVTTKSAVSPEEVIDESPDITIIVLILLAVIILALLIVFFIIFYHRRRRNKTKVPSQSGQQSSNRKNLHSSTKLTVHFSMLQAQEENIAIKTVGENDEENAYAVVDESKRKSKCDQEGPSSSEGEGVQSPPNDDHTAAHQSALKQNMERCDKGDDQEEKRDHIYAEVFVKESKAAVSGKTTASRDESLQVTCTEDGSNVDKDPVENLNPSSLEQGREMNSNEVTSEQDPLCSRIESNDHFYEVVDKSKKKRMAPKKPLPYRSGHLKYTDVNHLPNN